MKRIKIGIVLLFGVIPAYVFTSLTLNQKIISPTECFSLTPYAFSQEDILSGAVRLEKEENSATYRTTTANDFFEFTNLQEKVEQVRYITFEIIPQTIDPPNAPTMVSIYFSQRGKDIDEARKYIYEMGKGRFTFPIPEVHSDIDRIRVYPSQYKGMEIEIKEIALNIYGRFHWPLFFGIFALYVMITLNDYVVADKATAKPARDSRKTPVSK